MTDDFKPIRPRAVPLTRPDAPGPAAMAPPAQDHRRLTHLLVAASLLLLAAVFIGAPRLLEQRPADAGSARDTAANSAGVTTDPLAARPDDRGEIRAAAQAALRRFMDLQRELDAAMQVGDWGKDRLQRAEQSVTAGDEAFFAERFESATAAYRTAGDDLEALIAEGTAILEQALLDGSAAIAARDAAAAAAAFARAATVAPADARVISGTARAALLPEINALLLSASNRELAGDWAQALADLRQVERLDPATTDLRDAIDRVVAALDRSRLQDLVSTGFAHLEAGRHADARAAFEQVLKIDPANAAAAGALEQVARTAELETLQALESSADQALADERWGAAETLYQQALALDPNLQFAITGLAAARARRQADAALAAIIDDPDRLSSLRAYGDAEATLADAEALAPRGAKLQAQIERVRAVLAIYAEPVPVVLRSDNRTQITVSSVGILGAFEQKALELRPGAYTVIGSRDGCRDVRTRILVRPDMPPVDIRCAETL